MIINTVSASSGGSAQDKRGFENSTTVFNQDGSTTTTYDDCIVTMTQNSNGSITETYSDLSGTLIRTKTTTFTSTSVTETVVEAS